MHVSCDIGEAIVDDEVVSFIKSHLSFSVLRVRGLGGYFRFSLRKVTDIFAIPVPLRNASILLKTSLLFGGFITISGGSS